MATKETQEQEEHIRVVGTITRDNINGGIAIILVDLEFNNLEEAERFIHFNKLHSTLEVYPILKKIN